VDSFRLIVVLVAVWVDSFRLIVVLVAVWVDSFRLIVVLVAVGCGVVAHFVSLFILRQEKQQIRHIDLSLVRSG
jgi:hypothetical protein